MKPVRPVARKQKIMAESRYHAKKQILSWLVDNPIDAMIPVVPHKAVAEVSK